MERRRGIGSPAAAAVVVACAVLMMIPEVSSVRYMVGGGKAWSPNVNYTVWAQGKHFYNGDWLCVPSGPTIAPPLSTSARSFRICMCIVWGREKVVHTALPLQAEMLFFRIEHVTVRPQWGNFISIYAKSPLMMLIVVFVYDRNQQSVLEVNQTNYENCNSNDFLHNYTTGAGRDVVPLNETRPYYFICGNGFCYSGMKLAINVENPPPPPSASPVKSNAPTYTSRGQIVIPAVFAIAAVWDSFRRVW